MILKVLPFQSFTSIEEIVERIGLMSLREFIFNHLRLHPSMRASDVYKLLYQSVLGGEHLLSANWEESLRREYEAVRPDEEEPLAEPISQDGKVLRFNLRAFKAIGGRIDTLIEIFRESSQEIKRDSEKLSRLWEEFKKLVHQRKLPFDQEDVSSVDEQIRDREWPLLHHSRDYTKAEKPSYRVVHKDVVEKHFKLDDPFRYLPRNGRV